MPRPTAYHEQNAAQRRLPLLLNASLWAAIATPCCYYGAQLAGSAYFPGYSFIRNAASLLGSDLSTKPAVFNTGVFATEAALAFAAPGLAGGLRRLGVHTLLCTLIAASVITNAYVAFRAGWYPLPDPRHGSGAAMAGVLPFPLVALLAVWTRAGQPMRWYLIATNLLIGAMIPVMAGTTGIDRASYEGLIQRIATIAIFPPVAVLGGWTLCHLRSGRTGSPLTPRSSRDATHA